ncbi:site-specific integrase [Verrucosispora sp. WMMD1129]|uniref:tyrosine-type recombinase/integrase n=1 Tax=Verrucosispora sp. WMMD1129 TaxID=3016093 RepID=UPI00249BD687|nr:site-specific integrase [Verrucosispora sp. WMMD1129]WFE46276.1 tyrosine-type recombinase/integrase [Verrucosispora sp. WMMD1129]
MASVERRDDGRPKPWLVRWRDEAGKQRKKSFARKVDADRFRAEVEHKLNTGQYVDPKAGKQTFRAYAETWRAGQPHRPNTATGTRSRLTKHVYPVLGDRPLAAVRPSELQAFVTGLSATLKPGTVRVVYSTVRAVFGAALHDRIITQDPSLPARSGRKGVRLPERPRVQVTPLTVEQVDAILTTIAPAYRLTALVAAAAGLRQGEAFGLQAGDVDLAARTVKVDRQVQLVDNRPEVVPLKNAPSYRTVPVGQVLTDALKAHMADLGDGFLFLDRGGLLHRSRFNESVWRPAVKAAGLPGVGFHDLRHFYASALIRAGLSVKVVSARLGHGNAAETLNTYSHLWPDDEDRTRQATDDVLRAHVPHMRPADGK